MKIRLAIFIIIILGVIVGFGIVPVLSLAANPRITNIVFSSDIGGNYVSFDLNDISTPEDSRLIRYIMVWFNEDPVSVSVWGRSTGLVHNWAGGGCPLSGAVTGGGVEGFGGGFDNYVMPAYWRTPRPPVYSSNTAPYHYKVYFTASCPSTAHDWHGNDLKREMTAIDYLKVGLWYYDVGLGFMRDDISINDFESYYFQPSVRPPVAANLSQFKSDAVSAISESGVTTESTAVFGAMLQSSSSDVLQLQVELRRFGETFTGEPTASSTFIAPGGVASTTIVGLGDGFYHWRTRAVDSAGNASNWQEFGIAGNVDFEVKLVPLYTQVESDFPSRIATAQWAGLRYGAGSYGSCIDRDLNFSSIQRCGCAITSVVMMLRYHGVKLDADVVDVNPLAINAWLVTDGGYTANGNVIWPKVSEYSGGRVRFDGIVPFEDTAMLNDYLAAANPVLLYQASIGHFHVADGKLDNTYTIRDPRWFNTRYLTQSVTDPFTRDYGNRFTSLRLFSPVVGGNIVPDGMYFSIASPAELLITDAEGRRLGRDPVSVVSYNEIPGGSYYEEGISAAVDSPVPPHESKALWIPEPGEGEYNLQVIGTGEGGYALDSLLYDAQGAPHARTYAANTERDLVTNYTINFTPNRPEDIEVKIVDPVPPEAKVYFDPNTRQLKIEGVDDISMPTVSQSDDSFVIRDVGENTLKLSFERIKQEKKEVKAELESLQYNTGAVVEVPKAKLHFEWSVDNQTQQIKELEQKIEVKDQFSIRARYHHKKNETELRVKRGDGEEAREALPGLVVIKLITESGSLDFEF